MSDEENERVTVLENDKEPRNSHRVPPHTATTVAARRNACTCGICEACHLRAFLLEQGEKLGWKQLPYNVCSAVAAGEPYWRLFAVMHEVSVLRQVKEAILQAEQEAMASSEGALTNSMPEMRKVPLAQATDLWSESRTITLSPHRCR